MPPKKTETRMGTKLRRAVNRLAGKRRASEVEWADALASETQRLRESRLKLVPRAETWPPEAA